MTCYKPIQAWQRPEYPIYAGENEEYLKKLNRISFHEIPNWIPITIPCGKCIGCKMEKVKSHSTRCTLEASQWKNNCFITLTYSNHIKRKDGKPAYPEDNKLHKEDIQLFIKKLRKKYTGIEEWTNPNTKKIEKPIRYFGCGEHGPKTNRVHWHFCIFNWKPKDLKLYKTENKNGKPYTLWTSKELSKLWGYGFVVVGNLTEETANYVARYTTKKIKTEDECLMMSRNPGIAKWNWQKNAEKYKEYGILVHNTKGTTRQNLPKYFKKLWKQENREEYEQANYENKQKMKQLKNEQAESLNYTENFTKSELSTDIKNELKFDIYNKKREKHKIEQINLLKRNNFE